MCGKATMYKCVMCLLFCQSFAAMMHRRVAEYPHRLLAFDGEGKLALGYMLATCMVFELIKGKTCIDVHSSKAP